MFKSTLNRWRFRPAVEQQSHTAALAVTALKAGVGIPTVIDVSTRDAFQDYRVELRTTGLTAEQLQSFLEFCKENKATGDVRTPGIVERMKGYGANEVVLRVGLDDSTKRYYFVSSLERHPVFGQALANFSNARQGVPVKVADSVRNAVQQTAQTQATSPIYMVVKGASASNVFSGTVWTNPKEGTAGVDLTAASKLSHEDRQTFERVAASAQARFTASSSGLQVRATGVAFDTNTRQIDDFLSAFRTQFAPEQQLGSLSTPASNLTSMLEQLSSRNEDEVVATLRRLIAKATAANENRSDGQPLTHPQFVVASILPTYLPDLLKGFLQIPPEELDVRRNARTARAALNRFSVIMDH